MVTLYSVKYLVISEKQCYAAYELLSSNISVFYSTKS